MSPRKVGGLSWGTSFSLNQPAPSRSPKNTVKNQIFFCLSDRSYRNRKSHEIWGCLEAILRVLGLIYDRGDVEQPPVSNRVKYLRQNRSCSSLLICAKNEASPSAESRKWLWKACSSCKGFSNLKAGAFSSCWLGIGVGTKNWGDRGTSFQVLNRLPFKYLGYTPPMWNKNQSSILLNMLGIKA